MKSFKKTLAAVLAIAMMLSLAACGSSKKTESAKTTETATVETTEESTEVVEEESAKITFPLEEEMTFDLLVAGTGMDVTNLEKCDFWDDLYEMTNVKINITGLERESALSTLNGMFASGQEGDGIFAQFISGTDLSIMAANGLLMPLNEFVEDPELMPNFNERVLSESPETIGAITSPDGNIYGMPGYQNLEGNYLESPIWINKAWIDQLGMEMPTTIDELEEVLIAFGENDMNGNGKDDEIPYVIRNDDGSAHFEAFLGLYGIATKNSSLENYIFLDDGTVTFAPTTEAWKDAITKLNDWYEKGLIWTECFTATTDSLAAKLNGEDSVVGMYTYKTPPVTNTEDYVQLTPVSVEGYEANWYVHPGKLGIKGQFCVTSSCENPDVLMAWLDLFYSFENSVRYKYGDETDGYYEMVDGKVKAITLETAERDKIQETDLTLYDCFGQIPFAFTAEDYDQRMVLSDSEAAMQESYELYEEYLNQEIWPRPYFSEEDTTRISELHTDIANTVNEKKAAWITGTGDIDAEWEDFKQTLTDIGIDEYVEILQKTYDVYQAAQQ